jgi:hypothetical protein
LPQREEDDRLSATVCSDVRSGCSVLSRFFIRGRTARRADRGPSPGSRANAFANVSISWLATNSL